MEVFQKVTVNVKVLQVKETAQQSNAEEVITLQNVMVIGVPHLDIYKGCLNCRARVEPLTPPLGRCSRSECLMMQRYDLVPLQRDHKCEASANV